MSPTLLKALFALFPACLLLSGSALWFFRKRTVSAALQLVGAGCLTTVALAHVCEGLRLLPWMGWGMEQSVGHYVDLWSAVFGVSLFPIGYFLDAFRSFTQRT